MSGPVKAATRLGSGKRNTPPAVRWSPRYRKRRSSMPRRSWPFPARGLGSLFLGHHRLLVDSWIARQRRHQELCILGAHAFLFVHMDEFVEFILGCVAHLREFFTHFCLLHLGFRATGDELACAHRKGASKRLGNASHNYGARVADA